MDFDRDNHIILVVVATIIVALYLLTGVALLQLYNFNSYTVITAEIETFFSSDLGLALGDLGDVIILMSIVFAIVVNVFAHARWFYQEYLK